MKVEWSPEARDRAASIDAWWREERLDAPDRFTEELIAAIQKILDYAEVPPICGQVRGEPVRRVLLESSRQHVYYIVRPKEDVVRIHTIWGSSRKPLKL